MLELVVVTPYGEVFRGDVKSVVLPGAEGDFGVLEHHERFLAPLRVGQIEFEAAQGKSYGAISGGFADVSGHQVVVLAESAEAAEEIDVARAELARDRAREGLARLGADEKRERYEEYEAALERALNRLEASQRSR
jgi:F-type H+-transporting ATPase subunit epsilon